jgi:hypothetical protein
LARTNVGTGPLACDFASTSSSPFTAIFLGTLHHPSTTLSILEFTLDAHHTYIHTNPRGTIANMVFQPSKKHRGAKPEQSGTRAAFLDVPDELLLHMIHQTDITAVLRLRETSRFFVNACTEVIRDKLKILYIHPSPSSVKRAIAICKSDLSTEVEEVCFVSQSPDPFPAATAKGACFPWPSHKSQNGRVPLSDFARERGLGNDAFNQSYQELLSSLARLGRLQAFSFQESCDRPGLNMQSDQRISAWVQTIVPSLRVNRDRRAENALYALKVNYVQRKSFVFLDIDALQAVLNHPGFNFTRMKLGHDLPENPFDTGFAFSIDRPLTLTRLDLLATTYWKSPQWHLLCCELIQSTAPTLVELRLGIRHAELFHMREEFSMITLTHLLQGNDSAIKFLDLPKLQRLEFYSTSARTQTRPLPDLMVQWFDLEKFLANHCSRLRFLRLNEIVPILSRTKDAEQRRGADKIMRIMHKYLGVPAREITVPGLVGDVREWEINPVVEERTELIAAADEETTAAVEETTAELEETTAALQETTLE